MNDRYVVRNYYYSTHANVLGNVSDVIFVGKAW